ncbi:MAG: patatin-like phospholipase family protein [Solirubrobacteraceae bacterium]|nr:patatin-like phospholipase family protein [Solirubrobacteraceae bacterium]
MPDADLVLEGGGMKGIGLAGAVTALLRAGYAFQRVAGTSAGAIVGALLAAGVGERGLSDAMARLRYERVPDRGPPRLPILSEGLSLLHSAGAYEGDYIHGFVRDQLERVGVRTFADLRRTDGGDDVNLPPERRYRLVVTATDVTRGRLLRLPWDYGLLGLDPDEQIVADAVRASISIPLYFDPVIVRDGVTGEPTTLVDGGVLSNYPIETFDRTDLRPPRWPTLGVKIVPELPAGDPELFPGIALPALAPVKLLEQVVATAIVGNDQTYAERPCVRRRTINVDTSAVGIVEFDASAAQRDAVIANGTAAAERFLASWDWDAFQLACPPLPAR